MAIGNADTHTKFGDVCTYGFREIRANGHTDRQTCSSQYSANAGWSNRRFTTCNRYCVTIMLLPSVL